MNRIRSTVTNVRNKRIYSSDTFEGIFKDQSERNRNLVICVYIYLIIVFEKDTNDSLPPHCMRDGMSFSLIEYK